MNIIISFYIEISVPHGKSSGKKHLNLHREPSIAFHMILYRMINVANTSVLADWQSLIKEKGKS